MMNGKNKIATQTKSLLTMTNKKFKVKGLRMRLPQDVHPRNDVALQTNGSLAM